MDKKSEEIIRKVIYKTRLYLRSLENILQEDDPQENQNGITRDQVRKQLSQRSK